MKLVKRILMAFGLVLVLGAAGFAAWSEFSVSTMEEGLQAAKSTATVTVTEHGHYIAFENVEGADTGVIFYPGARVEAQAYAPMAQKLAEAGINVYMAHFPLDMAVFGANRADEIKEAGLGIENWYICGHSLGGAIGSTYYADHSDQLAGMIFLGSYPVDSLKEASGRFLSISGSEDGLSSVEDIEASRANLPDDTAFVVVEGGNHAQFGYYGLQGGDGEALISREAQQEIIVESMLEFLK